MAYRERNADALEAAVAELSGQTWLTPVPDDLRLGLQAAQGKVRQEAGLTLLKGLLLQILSAYHDKDLDPCVSLMSTWQAEVDSKQLVVPPEIQAKIRPVAAWIASESRSRAIEHAHQGAFSRSSRQTRSNCAADGSGGGS